MSDKFITRKRPQNVTIGTFVCLILARQPPQWARASSFSRFLDHTQRRTTVGTTPLDDRSARRRDLYLTTHNTHSRQTSIPLMGFERTISIDERPQTYDLDRAAIGTGINKLERRNIIHIKFAEMKYRGADKSLARPTSRYILFDG